MKKNISNLVLIMLVVGAVALWADDDKKGSQAASITKAEVKDHLYYIASDELEGRGTGSSGFKIAQQYAVTNFRQAGLKPIVIDADGKKTWYQEVPLVRTTPGKGNSLTLNGEKAEFAKDYILNNPRLASNGKVEGKLVFGSYGISEFEMGYDDLGEVDVDGNIVVILTGGPTADGKSILPDNVQALYDGRDAVTRKIENLERAGAATVILVADARTAKYWDRITARASGESVSRAGSGAAKQIPAIMVSAELAKNILVKINQLMPESWKEQPLWK